MPRVNLLTRPRREVSRLGVVRVLLVALVLLVAWRAWTAYQDWSDADSRNEVLTSRLTAVQQQLRSQRQQIADVQAQIDALRSQRQEQEAPAAAIDAARGDWRRAYATLFGIDLPGLDLRRADASLGGELTIEGFVPDVPAMASLRQALLDRSDIFDLRNLSWQQAPVRRPEGPPQLVVQFRGLLVLRGEGAGG